MSLANSYLVRLNYGRQGQFSCEIDADRVVAAGQSPEGLSDLDSALREALTGPLDFPPLEQAVIPGDSVVLALERGTPEAASLMAAIWRALSARELEPENLTILQPGPVGQTADEDPRSGLPAEVRDRVGWKVHNPHQELDCAYLATSVAGERLYLARDLIEADVVVTVGAMAYDPLVGYRGTNSVFYPGLSTADAIRRARGQGHSELGPENIRPLRQLMDEVGWLLGNQFSLQIIPSAGGGVAEVIAGLNDSVLRRGKDLLEEHWRVYAPERAELVVAAVDCDANGHGWEQVAAALTSARNIVSRGGQIVILSELEVPLGPGMKLLSEQDDPLDAIQPLREMSPVDMLPATQLALTLDWASVSLMSRLASGLVEGLFVAPLKSEQDVAELLAGQETCALLPSAQFTYASLRES